MLKSIYIASIAIILATLLISCTSTTDSSGTTNTGRAPQIGIAIPEAITAAAIEDCTQKAFLTLDDTGSATEMNLTTEEATVTIAGLSPEVHKFSIEFICINQQFPQGIVLANQSISATIAVGENKVTFPYNYSFPDMDADGFSNLIELKANKDPNNSNNRPLQGNSAKINDIVTSSTHSTPLLVFNDVGDGIAIWEVYSGTGRKLLYSLYSFVNNQWSAEALLSAQPSSSSAMTPRVATNGNQFVVVWKQINNDNTLLTINTRIYNAGSWQAVQQIVSYEGSSFEAAKITSNGSGYAVVWRQADNQNVFRLHAKIYDPSVGPSWGGAFTLSDPAALDNVDFDSYHIVSNGSGYGVVWEQRSGADSEAYANIFSAGSWLPGVQPLNELSDDSTSSPVMASNGSGYQAAWFQYDGSSATKVHSRGFD